MATFLSAGVHGPTGRRRLVCSRCRGFSSSGWRGGRVSGAISGDGPYHQVDKNDPVCDIWVGRDVVRRVVGQVTLRVPLPFNAERDLPGGFSRGVQQGCLRCRQPEHGLLEFVRGQCPDRVHELAREDRSPDQLLRLALTEPMLAVHRMPQAFPAMGHRMDVPIGPALVRPWDARWRVQYGRSQLRARW